MTPQRNSLKSPIYRGLRLIGISTFLFQQASAQAAEDFPSVAESYLHCKKDLKSDHGVSPNLNIVTHYQKADLDDDEQAQGWIFRFQRGWTAFARVSGHRGALKWRMEDRSGGCPPLPVRAQTGGTGIER